ncbi:hypothetical protein ABES02_21000 [Neobacillus pocheonensis]|uniref:hypothetical protein n=1 Tax=Neobacillus pocheonensis TaxID=363869 RepID=UPI003D2C57AD
MPDWFYSHDIYSYLIFAICLLIPLVALLFLLYKVYLMNKSNQGSQINKSQEYKVVDG